MNEDELLEIPVVLEFRREDREWQTLEARQLSDLSIPVEMMTGTGWMELLPLYCEMLDAGASSIAEKKRVCHSFEKWGDLQQEVVEVMVRMHLLREE